MNEAVLWDKMANSKTSYLWHTMLALEKQEEDPTVWLRPAPRQVDDRPMPSWSRPLWSLLVFSIVSGLSGWALIPVFALDDALNDRTRAPYGRLATWRLLVLLPLYHLAFCTATAIAALLIKWTCVGCYRPGARPTRPSPCA